jgi:hypothetical protein
MLYVHVVALSHTPTLCRTHARVHSTYTYSHMSVARRHPHAPHRPARARSLVRRGIPTGLVKERQIGSGRFGISVREVMMTNSSHLNRRIGMAYAGLVSPPAVFLRRRGGLSGDGVGQQGAVQQPQVQWCTPLLMLVPHAIRVKSSQQPHVHPSSCHTSQVKSAATRAPLLMLVI